MGQAQRWSSNSPSEEKMLFFPNVGCLMQNCTVFCGNYEHIALFCPPFPSWAILRSHWWKYIKNCGLRTPGEHETRKCWLWSEIGSLCIYRWRISYVASLLEQNIHNFFIDHDYGTNMQNAYKCIFPGLSHILLVTAYTCIIHQNLN